MPCSSQRKVKCTYSEFTEFWYQHDNKLSLPFLSVSYCAVQATFHRNPSTSFRDAVYGQTEERTRSPHYMLILQTSRVEP